MSPVESAKSAVTNSTFTSQSDRGQVPVLNSTGAAAGSVMRVGAPAGLIS